MRGRRVSGAFTLIELLIVVAIIAILAMIAVPNFLEAQVRAKISRSRNDQRTLALGIHSLITDRQLLLVDFWDDDQTEGIRRLQEDFALNQDHDRRGGVIGIYVPLTTPIKYLTSIPIDPFCTDKVASNFYTNLIAADRLPPYAYYYIDDESMFSGRDHGSDYVDIERSEWRQFACRPLARNQDKWLTGGMGPVPTLVYQEVGVIYDPTNGTASPGMIFRYGDD